MFNVYNHIEIVVKETQCDIIVQEFQSVEGTCDTLLL